MAIFRVGVGEAERPVHLRDRTEEGLDLYAARADARFLVPVARDRRTAVVGVRAAQVGRAAVDVLNDEVDAVEGVQLEVFEVLLEQRHIDVNSVSVELGARIPRRRPAPA